MGKKANDARCVALGQAVKRLRERQGMTQEKLAERADIHTSYIGQIERGHRYPSLKALFKIADALGTRLSDLFDGIK